MNNPYDIIISSNENATSFVELNDQYNALYNLLINNQREISYLDLYKITEYVNTPEDMVQIGSKFAQLNPNTAIGIGVPSVKFNGEEFYQGDLLLKLSNGQMQKLDAPSHGIYFPRWKEEGTSKKLIWVYSKDEPTRPSDGTDPQPVEMTDGNKAELLLYRTIPDANISNGYGQKIKQENLEGNFWSTSFEEKVWIEKIKEISDNGEEITKEIKHSLVPIIKCFNGSNEEILADIIVSLGEVTQSAESKKYTVSNIPSCVNYLMIR